MLDVLLAREISNKFKEIQLEGNRKSIPHIEEYFHSCMTQYASDIKSLASLSYALMEMRELAIQLKSNGLSKTYLKLRNELSIYVYEIDNKGVGVHFTNAEQASYQRDLE